MLTYIATVSSIVLLVMVIRIAVNGVEVHEHETNNSIEVHEPETVNGEEVHEPERDINGDEIHEPETDNYMEVHEPETYNVDTIKITYDKYTTTSYKIR